MKELNLHATILTDNAAFHKNEEIRALAEKEGRKVLFLPPYPREFNPLEQDFAMTLNTPVLLEEQFQFFKNNHLFLRSHIILIKHRNRR